MDVLAEAEQEVTGWPRRRKASCSCPEAGWLKAPFGWIARCRCLARDYERLQVAEQMPQPSGFRRLGRSQTTLSKPLAALAGTGVRTPDLLITNQLLYQLSYTGV